MCTLLTPPLLDAIHDLVKQASAGDGREPSVDNLQGAARGMHCPGCSVRRAAGSMRLTCTLLGCVRLAAHFLLCCAAPGPLAGRRGC